MKKILLLAITCLLLTGCTINYNLEIEDNYFKETITGNVLNKEIEQKENQTDINLFNYLINNEQTATINNNSFYDKTLNRNNNSIDYNYSFTYNEDTINNSRILNECFESFTFETKDNQYQFSTLGDFYCDYTDEIKINITTDYKVTNHNANKKNKNTYTWIINSENKDNIQLYMNINKNEKNNNLNISWNLLKTIGLIILLILSGICIYILKKKENE